MMELFPISPTLIAKPTQMAMKDTEQFVIS